MGLDILYLVGGIPTFLKNDGVVSWDDDIPKYGKIKPMFQTTNQIHVYICIYC